MKLVISESIVIWQCLLLLAMFVVTGDNLHEMSKPFSGKNKRTITNLSSAELAWLMHKIFKYKTSNETSYFRMRYRFAKRIVIVMFNP